MACLSLPSLPSAVIDKILDPLGFADIFKLGSTCKAFRRVVVAHVRSRRRVSPEDLPSRNVRCSSIFKTLGLVKQPHSLSLHLRLLPDFDFHVSSHSYGFTTSHLGTFKFLTNITLLLDEPRTNYSDGGIEAASSGGMLAPCVEAVCLCAAPVNTLMAGGLRYPNTASLTRAFSLMATYKTSIRRLHLIRLDRVTGDDLLQLTPEARASRRSSRKVETTLVEGSALCLHTTCQERLSDGTHADSTRASSASGKFDYTERVEDGLLGRLEALSVIECPKVADTGLAALLKHTRSLQQVMLVPDDDGVVPGYTSPRMVMHAGVPSQHQEIGPLCLQTLSVTASRLKYLYLSEELSPSSFGDQRLDPLIKAAVHLERLHLNIPVTDVTVQHIAQCCPLITEIVLLCANMTDKSLTMLFERCNKLTHITLCGSAYFGSRGIAGSFLKPLLNRANQICQLTLDSMHHCSADVIVKLLSDQLPPADSAVHLSAAVELAEAALANVDTGTDEPSNTWRSSALSELGLGVSSAASLSDGGASDVPTVASMDYSMAAVLGPVAAAAAVQVDETSNKDRSNLGNDRVVEDLACSSQGHSSEDAVASHQAGARLPSQPSEYRGAMLTSLTTLLLDNLPLLSKGGVQQITALLAQAPCLKRLSLLGYDGPIDTVLDAAVQRCPQLESVAVGGCRLLTDAGLQSLCRLEGGQLTSLSIQNCTMVSHVGILEVLMWHQLSMEFIDLWGTRACGKELAAMLASGRFKRVNIGGGFTHDATPHDALLRSVFNDLPLSCGTDLSTASPSLLLSQRVMFGPQFHHILARAGLPVE